MLCVARCRPDGATETLGRLRRHPDALVVDLAPLTEGEVAQVAAAALDDPEPPSEVVEFVVAHSDGNPFHVEELLAGLMASGSLAFDGHWSVSGILSPTVPTDVANSIRARTAAFDPTTRRVLEAAAVLGRRFDWDLLPGVAGVDGRTVTESMRAAVDAQLVEIDGHHFRFRHVLTREAVLVDLLPPERHELSGRARTAIERAHPGLPGPWCELAAELAEAAGDEAGAARLWVESARRALAAGALAAARTTAVRARVLASDSSTDAEEVAVQIASASGRPVEALQVGRPLLARMDADGRPTSQRVALALVLARAAIAAGDTGAAGELTSHARAIVDADELGELLPAVEAVAAHVALGDDDQRELDGLVHLEWWAMLPAVGDIARGITLGRQGRVDEAAEVLDGGMHDARRFATAGGTAHYVDLLLAEAQLRDGWGEPVPLLRAADALFAERGFDLIARRCRVALGRAGEKMPRRRGETVVPEHLRAVGITSRELDVLRLIVEGW